VGDIADRQSRLQPINQLLLGAILAIFVMIITNICRTRTNFKKLKSVSKICCSLRKNRMNHAKYFAKGFVY